VTSGLTVRSVLTAGEHVEIVNALPWVDRLVASALGPSQGATTVGAGDPPVSIVVEDARSPIDTRGWTTLGRDAWHRDGQVVIRDVATSGFDVRACVTEDGPRFVYRWRPPPRTRAASMLLRTRARLLARAILLQYPALWWASTRGRVPLHAPAVGLEWGAALLAGPSGVGKSTLVFREIQSGHSAVSDNLSVSDGTSVWGVVEPVRTEGGSGPRAPHGRREMALTNRVPEVIPDRVVVLRRGPEVHVCECQAEVAERTLTAATYAAGELRRFWTFAAMLALGTGIGPAHPPVAAVAGILTSRLSCIEIGLPSLDGVRLSDLLTSRPATTWT
jgi:hypothetical protein